MPNIKWYLDSLAIREHEILCKSCIMQLQLGQFRVAGEDFLDLFRLNNRVCRGHIIRRSLVRTRGLSESLSRYHIGRSVTPVE